MKPKRPTSRPGGKAGPKSGSKTDGKAGGKRGPAPKSGPGRRGAARHEAPRRRDDRPSEPAGRPQGRSGPGGRPPRPGTTALGFPAPPVPHWEPGAGALWVGGEERTNLRRYLTEHFPRLTSREISRVIGEGYCRVNGVIDTHGTRALQHRDVVEITLPPPQETGFDEARVAYIDERLVAYDKPAHLPTTPTDGGDRTSLEVLLREQYGPIFAVHRLDADTSGLVLFARTEAVAQRLMDFFRDRKVHKTYHAIVRGHPPASGTRHTHFHKLAAGKGFEKWRSGPPSPNAKEAITRWTVEQPLGRWAALVKVEPQTGRFHQIRIHFAELGHPVYGDLVYGDRREPFHLGRHLLHASRLELPDPERHGERLVVEAPLPAEMQEARRRLLKMR